MSKEILMFDNIEIEKKKSYHYKTLAPLNDVDTEKVFSV